MFPLKHFRYFQNLKIDFDVVDLRLFAYLEKFNKSIEIEICSAYFFFMKTSYNRVLMSFLSRQAMFKLIRH